MKQMLLIEGRNPSEFAEKYNSALCRLSGHRIESEKFLSDTSMYIFYDDDVSPDDQIEEIRKRAEAAFKECEPDFVVDATDEENADTETIEIRLVVNVHRDRYCCECDNYSWGRGCPYRDGRVELKDSTCPMFNIILKRG